MVALGVFGGGLLWMVLIGLRFDYLITVVYNGVDPGEAIWSIDPLFTILAAIPGISLTFAGLAISIHPGFGKTDQKLNLFYIGEIFLLVTTVTCIISFLGISGLIVDVVRPSAVLMGIIACTGVLHLFSPLIAKSVARADSLKLSRNTAILLIIELVVLGLVVVSLRLYIWSFIRSTSFVITSSGILGLLLLTPKFLNLER